MAHSPTTIDDDLRWTAATAEAPCPVCGATAGCGVAAAEGAVDCRRVPSERPMQGGGWLHPLPTGTNAPTEPHPEAGVIAHAAVVPDPTELTGVGVLHG